jgi:hypothetical protein
MQGWNSGLFTRDQTFALLGHAQETTQGTLIKILPGTEFRPIEDQPNASDTDNLIPKSGGSTTETQQDAPEPKELFQFGADLKDIFTSPSGHAPGRIVTNSTKH